jgi:hypothetical protein
MDRMVHRYLKHHPLSVSVIRLSDIGKDAAIQRVGKKELKVNGKMFDIIRSVKKEGSTLFYCIKDIKEDHLLAAMKKNGTSQARLGLLLQFASFETPQCSYKPVSRIATDVDFPHYAVTLISSKLPTWTPPPENV